jgi:hypothetical protein
MTEPLPTLDDPPAGPPSDRNGGRRRPLVAVRTTAREWLARRCVICGRPLEQRFYATCLWCRP